MLQHAGIILSLLSPIVLDMFDKENNARNQAVSLLVDGCCILVAPPLAGINTYFPIIVRMYWLKQQLYSLHISNSLKRLSSICWMIRLYRIKKKI